MKRRRGQRTMEKKQRKRRKRRKVRQMTEDISGRTVGPQVESTATGLKINGLSPTRKENLGLDWGEVGLAWWNLWCQGNSVKR